jgi:hypothetical protein
MRLALSLLMLVCSVVVACNGDRADRPAHLPDPEEASQRYGAPVTFEERVLTVSVEFPEEYRRGGTLWLSASPFFHLFSTTSRDLLQEYPDLEGIRVRTHLEDGTPVADAFVRRDRMHEFAWNRGISQAALAQTQGTERPRYVDDLIRWGRENVSSLTYNHDLIPR